ncbi:SDR family NAD(P)-dependent oxidoreductase [Bosea sp. RAF48]|uniref:SDR family NAD(P)-dependent oxidoreductase n=1 Tax=Bosea sp. RAF48 TaxID=3237480 RepID=UPI003F8DC29D
MSTPSHRKLAVVTGASAGIGAVYADRLAARGYDLLLIARRRDRLEEVARRIAAVHGREAEILVADLAEEADIAGVERDLAARGDIELIVNNAGIARFAPIAKAPASDSAAQIALNIGALTRLTHAVLPGFVARNRGTIVNIASILSLHTLPYSAVYSGTKAYVLAFSRGLQSELEGTAVKVQSVHPPATATDIWELAGVSLENFDPEKVMTTEDLVDAALAGLDRDEAITWPSVADEALWTAFDDARTAIVTASQTRKPAPRYAA